MVFSLCLAAVFLLR